MSIKWLALPLALLSAVACEDEDVIKEPAPITKNPELPTYTRPGQRGFTEMSSGDKVDRARFCDEAEASAQVVKMVQEPIIPDKSVGGVPIWGADGKPVVADDLLGRPEEGKLCDPALRASNGFAFGPLQELIIFFNPETRLVETIEVNTAYRGTMVGKVQHDGISEDVLIRMREKIMLGGRELSEYASSAQQGSRTNSWLNHKNLTLIYGMIRQTFFGGAELPADFDCVAQRRCDIIYTSQNEETPQVATIVFRDSGVIFYVSPEGQMLGLDVEPVRKATFELGGAISFGTPGPAPVVDPAMPGVVAAPIGTVEPVLRSSTLDGCVIDLANDMGWNDFRSRCVPADGERELSRANYDVHGQRDAVTVGFDGVQLDFKRNISETKVFEDGEPPTDTDKLYSVTYTRSFPAPSMQFIASNLAKDYAARLQAHLAASVAPNTPVGHPFSAFAIAVPETLSTEPQPIGALELPSEAGPATSWLDSVVQSVLAQYQALTPEQRAAVDPDALKEYQLTNPFVSAVMSAFSFGQSDTPESFTVLQTTPNERWSIGFSQFIQNGVPYRLTVQYSLFYGAVSSVTVERGTSEIDNLFAAVAAGAGKRFNTPYYDLRMADGSIASNGFGLGGAGILVGKADRRLGTLAVKLAASLSQRPLEISVPGTHIEDRGGYMRPLRGERAEFVPSHRVVLAGQQTIQVIHVLPEGAIGRVQQNLFPAPIEMCPGLSIKFGDDVNKVVEAWHAMVGDAAYQNCELVFEHSLDGQIVTGVSSVANGVGFDIVADRAVNAAIWQ